MDRLKLKLEIISDPTFIQGLRKISTQDCGFTFKEVYSLNQAIDDINRASEKFNAARMDTFKKLGQQSADGKNWFIEKSDIKATNQFHAELAEILKEEVEIYLNKKLTIRKPIELTALEMNILTKSIVDIAPEALEEIEKLEQTAD